MVFPVKDDTMLDEPNARNDIPSTAPRAASGCVLTNVRPVP